MKKVNNLWSFFRLHPPPSLPNSLSPDTAQILRALQQGCRSQVKPMPPPRQNKHQR